MSENAVKTVFIDGQAGTTGLQIVERLSSRKDLLLLTIDEARRKEKGERQRLLNAADFVILCLPDEAAREAVQLIEPGNTRTRVLDASTAHRTHADWAYGIPELSPAHRARIAGAQRVAVPGCHASGFALLVYPLIHAAIARADYPFSVHSLTGYTGGGKQMIAEYEAPTAPALIRGARPYALTLAHKHVPEMTAVSGLERAPIFQPIVCNFACGMIVNIPLHPELLRSPTGASGLRDFYAEYYAGQPFVTVAPYSLDPEEKQLDPQAHNGTNRAELFVFGDDQRMLAAARYDNLGKGASGAAVQCLNLMLGAPETQGL